MYRIEKQEEYPAGAKRYIPVHPDDVEITARALIDHISRFYKDIPVHYKIQEFGGQKVALLWSGDPKFYFGIGEGEQIPKYTQRFLDVDMSTITDNPPLEGRIGHTFFTSGQAAITMPVDALAQALPQMYAQREKLIAANEAILWSGADKRTPAPLRNDSIAKGPA